MGAGDWDVPRPGWTCDERGFDFDDAYPVNIATESIGKTGKRLRAPLTRGLPNEDLLEVLRTRPEPDQWSALEYACHVRDALDLSVTRVNEVDHHLLDIGRTLRRVRGRT